MEQAINKSVANKRLRISAIITLVLLIISFLWLFYDLYAFIEIRAKSPVVEKVTDLLGIGFIIQLLLLFSLAILLLKAFKSGAKADVLVIACTIAGTVAAISMIFDTAALHDIGKDYLIYGYDCTMEWLWLSGSLIFRLFFLVILSFLIVRILKRTGTVVNSRDSVVDEVMFEVTQYVGIVCGFIGVVFTIYGYIALGDFVVRDWLLWLLMFYCLIIILPWFSLIIYWIIRLSRRSELTLYDEKQKQDFASSGMIVWLASIPVMIILLIISLGQPSSPTVFLWFPFYLFFSLLVFSASLLLKFKKG
jgi:hypothetical protein